MAYAVYEKVSSSQYESYNEAIFANSSKSAFSNRGYPLHYYTAGFMYDGSDTDTEMDDTAPAKVTSQIKIRDEQFATRTKKSNRYHYAAPSGFAPFPMTRRSRLAFQSMRLAFQPM